MPVDAHNIHRPVLSAQSYCCKNRLLPFSVTACPIFVTILLLFITFCYLAATSADGLSVSGRKYTEEVP